MAGELNKKQVTVIVAGMEPLLSPHIVEAGEVLRQQEIQGIPVSDETWKAKKYFNNSYFYIRFDQLLFTSNKSDHIRHITTTTISISSFSS